MGSFFVEAQYLEISWWFLGARRGYPGYGGKGSLGRNWCPCRYVWTNSTSLCSDKFFFLVAEFRSLLAFRQHHKMPSSFGMSDIYAVCRMEPRTLTVHPCPIEIVECRWRSLAELLAQPQLTPLMRRILQLVQCGLDHGFDEIDIAVEKFDSIWPGMTYNLFHKKLPATK
jgi:hypothetical protein